MLQHLQLRFHCCASQYSFLKEKQKEKKKDLSCLDFFPTYFSYLTFDRTTLALTTRGRFLAQSMQQLL
jgi:hypothetical protein